MVVDNHSKYILKWRLYSKTWKHKHRVGCALRIIEEAKKTGLKWSISWSGGKDSTSLTHLVKSVIPEAVPVSQLDDCDWPEKQPYIESVAAEQGWSDFRFACPDFSVQDAFMDVELLEKVSAPLDKVNSNPVSRAAFVFPLCRVQKELDVGGFFMGLRSKESIARKINFIKNGNIYSGKDGFFRCLPLERWEAIDSFAYLVSNDIGINPCYFQNRFLEPEDIRTSWAIPSFITPSTVAVTHEEEHLKYYYPEIWEKLKDRGICY
jgi:3'-phosphoadenosine 5'-phosphosulfate sulfotransferase (PAPS reductase)/FAD synthetase